MIVVRQDSSRRNLPPADVEMRIGAIFGGTIERSQLLT